MKFFRLPPISLSEVGWGQVVLEAAVPCGKFLRLPSGDWTESRCVGQQQARMWMPRAQGSGARHTRFRSCLSAAQGL